MTPPDFTADTTDVDKFYDGRAGLVGRLFSTP